MNKKDFNNLKESVIEAGKIMRGEMKASREFVYEVDDSEIQTPVETWAVCVEGDEDNLLIPGKIYRVKKLVGGFWVRDEEGEATLCTEEFFVPISLPAEVSQKLDKQKIAA